MQQDDVIDVLLSQHARIEELFAATLDSGGEQRRQNFEELVRLLTAHEAAEERIVHPYAKNAIDAGAGVVADRVGEEQRAKEQLIVLQESGPDAADFDQRLIALRNAVLMHASAEERCEFKYLRETVDAERLRTMASDVLAAEREAPRSTIDQPH